MLTKCFRISSPTGKGAPSHNLESLNINAITVLLIDGASVVLYIYTVYISLLSGYFLDKKKTVHLQ